ncbi:MAG: hypothetical protein IPF92_18065 [Myxococcales bacterium]|nr:hypothetical protein [Myxococcales bacterium]MBL0196160.1 hypothetical protein [Myxococcales bacterium]HQY63359.1 hypothetical protein [Polyangiaceae bacterium]
MTSPDAPETTALPSATASDPLAALSAEPATGAAEAFAQADAPGEPEAPGAAVPHAPGVEPPADDAAAEAIAQPAAMQAESAVGPFSYGWPPPVSAGPYRTPPYEGSPHVLRGPRLPWAILGPSLRVFAVLLWSYVVVGQFTASWPLGRPISPVVALALVSLLTLLAWIVAFRTSLAVAPAANARRFVGRGLAIAAGGFALFVGAVLAPIVGVVVLPHTRGYDLLVGFALVSVSLVAALLGDHISHSPDLPRPTRTHGQRFVTVLAWMGGVALTLIAGADLAGAL